MRSAENLIRDLLELTGDFLSNSINNENLEIVNYKPGPNLGQDYIEQIDIDNVHEFEGIKSLVEECDIFFRDRLEIANYRPFAYVIKFEVTSERQNDDESIFIFQHIQKQNSFRKGKIINRFLDTYDSLGDELYFLSDKFDCLYYDFENNTEEDLNKMFIFRQTTF